MTSLIIPAHIAAQRAPVAQLNARELGASGNQLLGEMHANTFWIGLMQEVIRKSNDSAEKRVARDLIEVAGEYIERIQRQLADVSKFNRAIELFKPEDRDIRQDVLQGKFELE